MRPKISVLAVALFLPLSLAACSGDGDSADTTTTTTTTSTHQSQSSAPPATHNQQPTGSGGSVSRDPVPTQQRQQPRQEGHGTPPAAPQGHGNRTVAPSEGEKHDDDPGGHACTDQSGAPGHYVEDETGSGWICEITGDAPRS